jgi:hypothetical protein
MRCKFFSIVLMKNNLHSLAGKYVSDSVGNIIQQIKIVSEFEELGRLNKDTLTDPAVAWQKRETVACVQGSGHLATAATQWFENQPDKDESMMLPARKLDMVWKKVLPALKMMGETKVDGSALVEGGDGMELELLSSVTGLVAQLCAVRVSFFYLVECLRTTNVVREYKVRPNIVKAMQVCTDTAAGVFKTLADPLFKQRFFENDLETVVARDTLATWCGLVSDLLLNVKVEVCKLVAIGLDPLNDMVRQHVPHYDHIVNDNVYSKELAKKVILQHPFTEALAHEVEVLYGAIFDLSKLVKSWAIEDCLEHDESWLAARENCTKRHNEGKQFLKVRAACAVVQTKSGQTQVDEAKPLVEKKGTLPETLEKALNSAIACNGGAGAKGGFTKRKADAFEPVADSFQSPDVGRGRARGRGRFGSPFITPSPVGRGRGRR